MCVVSENNIYNLHLNKIISLHLGKNANNDLAWKLRENTVSQDLKQLSDRVLEESSILDFNVVKQTHKRTKRLSKL